jgi:hypothetical protein
MLSMTGELFKKWHRMQQSKSDFPVNHMTQFLGVAIYTPRALQTSNE